MTENGEPNPTRSITMRYPNTSMIDASAAYQALVSRDPRFDGIFFVGVASTGVYCRPICPARTPIQSNCRFFETAGAAEKASFRPCLRCRPELAPGQAPVDHSRRLAQVVMQRMEEGAFQEGASLGEITSQLGISPRQFRRIVHKELGVTPIDLLQTRRLLLAKQLLIETRLPIIEIAFASGFSSLRRFNDAFSSRYRMPPTQLRQRAGMKTATLPATDTSTLQLSYRPPYDWARILEFLQARLVNEVEYVTVERSYARTIRLGDHTGWIRVRHAPERRALLVEFTHSLVAVLPALLGRLRHLFDLIARPDLIAAQLAQDQTLAASVKTNPGLRVPGAFDAFETAVRAVLGQQVTVKAATTLACRFADAFGEKVSTPFPGLTRLSPTPQRIANCTVDDIARLGIIRTRAASIIALAQAFHSGSLRLDPGDQPEPAMAKLINLPGIGPWTAQYLAMRALHWPDAFPKEDIAVRKNLGRVTAKKAEEMSRAWSPWRSYAVMHIWAMEARDPTAAT